jgi:quinolinate synthase
MTPEIFHGVGDFVGDSLALAREAARCDAKMILQAGVHFMAETSKVLSPDKRVLIPDLRAGCSLASSITGADVRLIKQRYPGLPVVTYVNTTADVKAETDICCTSANAVQVVEAAAREWGVDRVILIPDEFLARNVARQTTVGIIASTWPRCASPGRTPRSWPTPSAQPRWSRPATSRDPPPPWPTMSPSAAPSAWC